MSPQPSREETLFIAAADLATPEERAAFLDRECACDVGLRQRVEALLRAADNARNVLDDSPADQDLKATVVLPVTEKPGDTIGRYKLLQQIGEGGCGVVYMAEQSEPVKRRVALKVIKLGMDTKQVVARFEAERQALALMDHPHIAKVLDAGATDTGRPYFVMELVRGTKVTEFCDQQRLSNKARLELFTQVCSAVQHAHQKGIIHRDLKPSNVLVTMVDGKPVPKVIDFGIAKATTDQRLTDKTLFTAFEQFIGTPAYMSPEQAEMSGVDIDTRSDIYSLGVLLYELLTGRTPFDAQELLRSGVDGIRKTLREKEPVKPSTKLNTLPNADLTTVAKAHQANAPKLIHSIRGDLDWIVMKCLEKDRSRRYETANGLAADIQRHLTNEPVVARPPSTLYRLQKTFRRNKLIFTAASAVVVALLSGLFVSTTLALYLQGAKWRLEEALKEAKMQRDLVMVNKRAAERSRHDARMHEKAARRQAYASEMNVAKQALDKGNFGLAVDLLNHWRPTNGEDDLRGWEWRYLWQQTRSDALFTLSREPDEVDSMAFSPDGHWLAVGYYHKAGLHVWDLRSHKVVQLATNQVHVKVAFSPTDPVLAYTDQTQRSENGEVEFWLHLWDRETGKTTDVRLNGNCEGLAFSKDGRTLLTSTSSKYSTGGSPTRISLWSVERQSLSRLNSFESPQGWIGPSGTPFAVTPDLQRLACSNTKRRGEFVVMDLREEREVWKAESAQSYTTALAFSPDGKILASAGGYEKSDIVLRDAATGREIGRLPGHGSFVSSLVFLSDGQKLASASGDQTIRIWDLTTRQCVDILRGHVLEVFRLALHPDGKRLVSGSKDGTVCFWDTSVPHPHDAYRALANPFGYWSFAPDSQAVLTVSTNGSLQRWAGRGWDRLEPLPTGMPADIKQARFSADSRYMILRRTNELLQVWDMAQGKRVREMTNYIGNFDRTFLSTSGQVLVNGRGSGANLWDLETGQSTPLSYPRHLEDIFGSVSEDGRWLMATGDRGKPRLTDLSTREYRDLDLDLLESANTHFSPDGHLFAASSGVGYARVWETASWKEQATLRGYMTGLRSVIFSPDGKRLVTGGDGQEALRFWDVESWRPVLTLEALGAQHTGGRFSPDGNSIGMVNSQWVLHVWSAPSWEEIAAVETKDPFSPGYDAKGRN